MASRPTRSTARLAAILDRLPDALLLVDPAGIVENANAKALEAFSAISGQPLIGLSLGELLPSMADVAEAADGADGKARRMVARSLDGVVFGVEVTCTPVPWGGGEERLLISMHHSGGIDAEAELVRTGRATQAVLRSTEEAVCGVDRDGRVVLANPAAGRLFGVRVSAIAGQELHSAVWHTKADGTPYPPNESPVARTLRTGRRIQRRPEIVWRADGTPVPVEVSTAPIKDGSEVVGAVFALTDVTESHELNRRRNRLIDLLTTEVEPLLAAFPFHAEAARVQAALTAALDYEDLMAGEGWGERPATEVNVLLAAAADVVRTAAKDVGVLIEVDDYAGKVPADSGRLTAGLAELLRLAVAASGEGEVVELGARLDGGRVRLTVAGSDGGRPLAESMLEYLRAEGGPAGPDLGYVQLVAEGHDGRLLIEAAPGRRTFVLDLPVEVKAAPVARPHRRHARTEAPPAPSAVPPVPTPPPAPPSQAPEISGNVIPMPARRPGAEATEARPVVAEAATEVAVEDRPRPTQVLTWPRAGAGLADALGSRGLGSVALDRRDPPAVVPAGTAVVLVDPQGGTLGRKMLHSLAGAVSAARLPLVLTVGLSEFGENETASEPTALIGAVLPPADRPLNVLVVEPDAGVAAALGDRLTELGYVATHARTDTRAAARAGEVKPDLVLRNLALPTDRIDWLRNLNGDSPVPVIAYTTSDLTVGHSTRLSSGQSKLGLAARASGPDVEDRLAGLLAVLGG